jgi:pimeloyl-ACP methyl ester carboxylesterase
MFEGFEEYRISTRDAEIFVRAGGVGPPVLLLHGYPRNHVMWHAVAPRLRDRFALVLPDLRGYGDSQGPPPDAQHVHYSKRAMANEGHRGGAGRFVWRCSTQRSLPEQGLDIMGCYVWRVRQVV